MMPFSSFGAEKRIYEPLKMFGAEHVLVFATDR